jgi:hypothetical protein
MSESGVWQQLDYSAGQPSRGTHRLIAIALAVGTVAALGLVVLFRSGVITPRVGWPREHHGMSWTEQPGYLSMEFEIENHGLVPVTIVGIGEDLPGMELQPSLAGWFPLTLAAGGRAEVQLAYRVSDCAALHRLNAIPVRLERYWGTQTGEIESDIVDRLHCKTPLDQG